jgi:phosphoglucan,water dikinase
MSSTTAAAIAPESSTASTDRCAAFAEEVARICGERGSWRRRLEWVRDLVRDGRAADPAVLSYLGVFLKLVATGSIPSKEDGGHFRPSHHAELGLEIERLLLQGSGRAQRALVRGILRWLPSHDLPFRRAEPLTRIRDIAHRNDIPHALKEEIKHTLQNKLHRSAGPEDLATSAALLARFTQPGAPYPEAFVAEFRRFHDELAAFFNAGSVEEDLEHLLPELGSPAAEAARDLLDLFPLPLDSANRIDRELAVITRLRQALDWAFTEPDSPTAQKLRLADLKLDERAFVLLAERNNRIEAGHDSPSTDSLLALLAEIAAQLALSGVEAEHMDILAAAARSASEIDSDQRLRLARARFQTAHTVLGWHADHMLRDCASFASELGQRLQIQPYIVEQFAAREIRGNLAFQLSRMVDRGLALTAEALHLPPWQAVVPGTAQGRLLSVERLDQLALSSEPTLVLVAHLDGDEELPQQVRGLLVGHDLPHLSHVAIRARQAGVPMAARRDSGQLEDFLVKRLGQPTALTIGDGGLALGPAADSEVAGTGGRAQLGPVSSTSDLVVLALEQAELANAGAKAWGARRLAGLAGPGGFRVPAGFVVPFGVMEACLAADPGRNGERQSLLSILDDPTRERDWPEAALRLQRLIQTISLPEPLLHQLGERVASFDRVAVRSSSNAEDRKGAVGAGLFESVIGVRAQDIPSAVCRVWASLYGGRALATCRGGHVHPRDLHMAVLVQAVVPSELSFVMYTRSPLAETTDAAYVELAAGLGETLAGATGEGSPYRLVLDRSQRRHWLTSYLSYPDGLVLGTDGEPRRRPTRFHELRFERDRAWRERLAERLLAAADLVERELGGPQDVAQDVEGAVVGDELWLLQSRPAALTGGEPT